MAKQSGLGDNLFVQGFDISGDVGSLSAIGGGFAPLDVTAINKSAVERIPGLRDGRMEFVSFFNDAPLVTGSGDTGVHIVLDNLPRTDVICTYTRGTALGAPAASLTAKQVDYAPTRAADGSFTFQTTMSANGYGIEWGELITVSVETETAAATGTGVDFTAGTSFGLQAYLQVTEFVGTSATVTLQHSTDDVTYSAITGGAFSTISTTTTAERIQTARDATINRYVRYVVSGTFTTLSFNVNVIKNQATVNF